MGKNIDEYEANPDRRWINCKYVGYAIAGYGYEYDLTPAQLQEIFEAGIIALACNDYIPKVTNPELLKN